MDNKQWDALGAQGRQKLLRSAGLSSALAQLRYSSLSKAHRSKLEKGKGWFEAKEPIKTRKGIEHKAPEHHRVAIRKEAGTALNTPMERKEEKVASDEPTKKEEDEFSTLIGKGSQKQAISTSSDDIAKWQEQFKNDPKRTLKELQRLIDIKDIEGVDDDKKTYYFYINHAKKLIDQDQKIMMLYVWAHGNQLEQKKIDEARAKIKSRLEETLQKIESQRYKPKEHGENVRVLREIINGMDKSTKLYIIPELPRGIKLDADEEKFVSGIYKQVSEGAIVKEFGTRLYVWKGSDAYATKHITDSEYTALKPILKGVHQRSRAEALKNLSEQREKESKIAEEIGQHKFFKEAQKTPKGGAVEADADNIQAWTAEMIARRFALNPEAVYDWAQKHHIILKNIFNKEALGDGTNIIEAVLNDTVLGKPTQAGKYFVTIGFGKNKHREYVNDANPFEVKGIELFSRNLDGVWHVTEQSTGVQIAIGRTRKEAESNAMDLIKNGDVEALMNKLKRIEASESPRDMLDENLAEAERKKEAEQEKEKKAKEKWITEERNKPPRKPAKTPEIEFDPHEGTIIRGLTKEQAEEFRKELQEKKVKGEMPIRKGVGGKYELISDILGMDEKVVKLFTKRFEEKPKRIIKREPAHESTPLLVEYKCLDKPPVKVPIEKLDEEIERCKKEGEEHYKDLGLTGQGEKI